MKQLKRILAFVMVLVLSVTFIPISASAASTKSKLEANIAKWEKELDAILARDDVVYIEKGNIWLDERLVHPQIVVYVSDENHPFDMSYAQGYYIKNIPDDEAKYYDVTLLWSGYVQILDEPLKYAFTVLGSIPCYTCLRVDRVYELEDKIQDAKLKLSCVNGKLSCSTKSMKLLYNDKYSYNMASGSEVNGYMFKEDNYFSIPFKHSDLKDYSGSDLDKYIIWKSSNPKVASVENVHCMHYFSNNDDYVSIKVHKPGKCTITGKLYGNSKTVKVNITVAGKSEGISITPRSAELEKGETVKLSYKTRPKYIPEKVCWVSSDVSVATVSGKGTVKAVGAGTALIFAYTDGGSVSLSCRVKVNGTPQTDTNVNSFSKAITAIKTSSYVQSEKGKSYLYEVSESNIKTTYNGREYILPGYDVNRFSPISEAIKYRYTNERNSFHPLDTFDADQFFVFPDGKIAYLDQHNTYCYITDYFANEDNPDLEKYEEWITGIAE